MCPALSERPGSSQPGEWAVERLTGTQVVPRRQTGHLQAALYTHHWLLTDWQALTERFVRHSGRIKKFRNRSVCLCVCVCVFEYVTSAGYQTSFRRRNRLGVITPSLGPPWLLCTLCHPQTSPPARCMSCGLIVMRGGKIMGAGGLCTSTKVPICIPPPPSRNATLLHFSFKLQLIPGAVQRGSRCYRLLRPTPRRHNPPTPLSARVHTYVCSFSRLALQRTQKKIVESSREKTQE